MDKGNKGNKGENKERVDVDIRYKEDEQ